MIEAHFSDVVVDYRLPGGLKDRNLHVPDSGSYSTVLPDWQMRKFNFEPRQRRWPSVPATRMMEGLKPGDFMPMNKAAQYWLYELLAWAANYQLPDGEIEYYYTQEFHGPEVRTTKDNPVARVKCTYGSLKWVWEDLVCDHRAFTDGHAPDSSPGHADYILGRNLNGTPFDWKSLITTGNIVKTLGAWSQNPQYMEIEALDMTKPLPSVEWIAQNKPHLIAWATQQTNVKLPDGRWQVSKFPQLKLACREHGLPEAGTPFPVIGINGRNRILKEYIAPVKNGEAYSQYVP